jgi:serine/threonine protein kinase
MKSLEIIHNSGFIYGDLKLDNIMLGNQWKDEQRTDCEESIFEGADLHIIDFGFSKSFKDDQGKHLDQTNTENFYGNLLFSSLNQLNFKSQSRRDDLLSICYMLSSLLNGGSLPGIALNENQS